MEVFSKDIKSKILVIELLYFTNSDMEDCNTRRYYEVELTNRKTMLVLTSDEPNNPEQEQYKIIEESFVEVPDFKELVKDFEFSKFTNHHIQAGFNSPPKYSYYHINYIDDKFKSPFKEHLAESISGYTEGDLTKEEELNIWIWNEYLTNND